MPSPTTLPPLSPHHKQDHQLHKRSSCLYQKASYPQHPLSAPSSTSQDPAQSGLSVDHHVMLTPPTHPPEEQITVSTPCIQMSASVQRLNVRISQSGNGVEVVPIQQELCFEL